MTLPILAAAQFHSLPGALEQNLVRHLTFMQRAAEQGANYLLFPELSLTGYEPDIAPEWAVTSTDVRLEPLKALAMQSGLVTTVGVPIKMAGGTLRIGALTFTPGGEVMVYAKQYLHPGEDSVFSPGQKDCLVPVQQRQVGLCVCADFSHAEHVQRAVEGGAWVYAASVLVSPQGYEHDASLLQGYARHHRLPVLMANHAGPTGGWQSAGRSGLWNEKGQWVGGFEGEGEGLVIATCQPQGWQAQTVRLA